MSYYNGYDELCVSYRGGSGSPSRKINSKKQPFIADECIHQLPRQMIGVSRPIQEVKIQISRIARTDATVLITGDTGTGKELAAEQIHLQSRRHCFS